MRILLVAATEKEISLLLKKLEVKISDGKGFCKTKNHEIDILITGVGMVATTYHLTKYFSKKNSPDIAINAGVAGAFSKKIKLGEVVQVIEDCFADMGAEDGEKFLTLEELTLNNRNGFPFRNGKLRTDFRLIGDLKKVKGISVNTTHGNARSIKKVKQKFSADVETMEGAAFAYCCLQYGVCWSQIRSISNYIELRDKSKWDIPLAIRNMNQLIEENIIKLFSEK